MHKCTSFIIFSILLVTLSLNASDDDEMRFRVTTMSIQEREGDEWVYTLYKEEAHGIVIMKGYRISLHTSDYRFVYDQVSDLDHYPLNDEYQYTEAMFVDSDGDRSRVRLIYTVPEDDGMMFFVATYSNFRFIWIMERLS